MPKYKRVNEDIVDTFINKLFLLVGKGLESATIRGLSKSDPELAKHMKDLKQTRKDIEKTIKVLKEFLKNPPVRCWD